MGAGGLCLVSVVLLVVLVVVVVVLRWVMSW